MSSLYISQEHILSTEIISFNLVKNGNLQHQETLIKKIQRRYNNVPDTEQLTSLRQKSSEKFQDKLE